MQKALLEDRALIAISGLEARPFLQGLITNDIEKLAANHPLYAALLTPQGKILFDFFVYDDDGTMLVDCFRDGRDALMKRLSLYRLRSKVSIERRDDLVVVADASAEYAGSKASPRDPRLAELGTRRLVPRSQISDDLQGLPSYLDHRISLGVPESSDFGSDRIFALDAGLEELHGVSFDKGCYIGQELSARMKHRGTARKRLLPIEAQEEAVLPRDAALTISGRNIGDIASSYGRRGFALVRVDRLVENEGGPAEVSGIPVLIKRPNWLFP